jgi:hypothetical protein
VDYAKKGQKVAIKVRYIIVDWLELLVAS